MADISKITIENGTYNIKDETARQNINDLNNDIAEFKNNTSKQIQSINIPVQKPLYKVIGHRGASLDAPENSISAFKIAGYEGMDGIETDIQKTSDGQYVCFHDKSLSRMISGQSGNINTYTLAQLQNYKLTGGNNVSNYPNETIPTLYNFLDICYKQNLIPVLELKDDTLLKTDAVNVFNTVKAYGLDSKAIFISFNQGLLEAIREISPSAKLQLLTSQPNDNYIAICKQFNFGLDSEYSITGELADALHLNGIEIGVWTIENPNTYQTILQNNIRPAYITTNSIDYIRHTNYDPSYIGYNGIYGFSKFEEEQIKLNGILVRSLYKYPESSTNFLRLINEPNIVAMNRAVSLKIFKCKQNQVVSYINNYASRLKLTFKIFTQNGQGISDLGWKTGSGSQSITISNSGVSYFVVYFGTTNDSAITYLDKQHMNEILNSIVVS